MTGTVALGEVQALVAKAARGAGRSFGVAEDAGRAARWLSANGLDGAGLLARLLQTTDGATHADLSFQLPGLEPVGDAICPMILGAYLSDARWVPEAVIGPVLEPSVLLPFLAELAGPDVIRLSVGDVSCCVSADGTQVVALPGGAAKIRIERIERIAASGVAGRRPITARACMSAAVASGLTRLATRTYAPATDASRASGAGAGTTDND